MSMLFSYPETWYWLALMCVAADIIIRLKGIAVAASLAALVLGFWLWLTPFIHAGMAGGTPGVQSGVGAQRHMPMYEMGEVVYAFAALWLLMLLLVYVLRTAHRAQAGAGMNGQVKQKSPPLFCKITIFQTFFRTE